MADREIDSEHSENLKAFTVCCALLLAVSVGLRIYYLWLTRDQAVWWDEANYLVKAKQLALGTPATGYDAGRPILFSIVLAPFFKLGLGEHGIRLALSLSSLLSVYLLYKVGARLLGEWAGLIAAALYSVHALNLFLTHRVMCEIPYITLALLGLDFFLSGDRRLIWAAGPMFGLSVMMRYPAAIIPVCLLLYVLVTERKQALVNKDYYISAGLAALTIAPDILLRGSKTVGAAGWMMVADSPGERWANLSNTVLLFLSLFHPLLLAALALGLLLSLWTLLRYRRYPADYVKPHLLLWLLLIGPLALHGLAFNHVEDRYLLASFLAAVLFIGSLISRIVTYAPASLKEFGFGLGAVAVVLMSGFLLRDSHRVITQKKDSYRELRDAGLWIKAKSNAGDVVTKSVAQLTYYSERVCLPLPDDQAEFEKQLAQPSVGFVVLSNFEAHPGWVNNFNLPNHGLQLVYANPEGTPRVLVIKRIAIMQSLTE